MRVAFGHHNIAVRLHNIERAQFNELDHGVIKGRLHGVEIIVLLHGQVLLHGVLERRGERIVDAFRRIRPVAFGQLPNEHGRQILLTSGQEHITRCGNTGLEVIGDRRVFSRAQGLEPVVPPRDEGRLVGIRHIGILIR